MAFEDIISKARKSLSASDKKKFNSIFNGYGKNYLSLLPESSEREVVRKIAYLKEQVAHKKDDKPINALLSALLEITETFHKNKGIVD